MSTGFAGRAVRAWRRLEAFHEEWFAARWRHALQREDRRQADTFRAMLLLHSLGVDVPVAYETLDLIPYLVADVHDWHRRMGRDRWGDAGVCC
ncbi:hypothetical protein JCM3263A_24940 [Thermobifida fusca]|uniref:DNA helicase n=2 Tax=Thermobifida fusca TaxID=2021 RepID=A0A9P2WR45_THEFU|nr:MULTISPECIES: cory-CC-star protein [Thermobifida]AAZ55428.1 conserved hypothetical protein [Thermobifida fusca YX]EOR71461.1 hypothetical protein TM51_07316 [Thermobifida fusca TM51]MBO2530905.1 hypothetical protein [Thermobifida sp.]MDD6791019.1 cory-CC-star protein [Thermobifida fusca]PPS91710.1 hypothetical protein BH05_13730 [Thermobifida fusca]